MTSIALKLVFLSPRAVGSVRGVPCSLYPRPVATSRNPRTVVPSRLAPPLPEAAATAR